MSRTELPPLRVGTRGSELALFQARRVAGWIETRLERRTQLVIIETTGDADRSSPLSSMGSVGVFTKELEKALLDRRIDVAVHSLKDLPTVIPPGLALAAVPERVDVRDALIARVPLEGLPPGARVGTSSRRRRVMVEAARPDLRCEEIRGNVPTRLEKCRRGDYDAILLAAAGLDRLDIRLGDGLRRFDQPLELFLPAPGQGALGIETRSEDAEVLAPLNDVSVAGTVAAERALLRLIEGGCSVPLGAHARRLEDGRLELCAALGAGGKGRLRRALVRADDPEAAARLAFRVLRPDGADRTESEEALDSASRTRLLDGRRVVLTRPDPDLEALLVAAGAAVRTAPAIETVAVPPPAEPPRARWTLVTSARTAPLLAAALTPLARAPLERVGAVGPATAEALARVGVPVDLIAEENAATGLADAFQALGEPVGTRVCLPGARDARPELRARLEAAGYEVAPLVLYETRALAPDVTGAEVVVLASPSAVAAAASGAVAAGARAVAIGAATAEAARARGLATTVAERPTAAGLFEAIRRALAVGD